MYRLKRYLLCMLVLFVSIGTWGQYNPTNPSEPGQYYTLTLEATPSEGGSFSISKVSNYTAGTSVRIRAYSNTNFGFVAWEKDGEVYSTSSQIDYPMPAQNVKLVAHYSYNPSSPSEPVTPVIPIYSGLYLHSDPSDGGSFNINSGNRYESGTSVKVKAYTNSDFAFVNWTENGEIISTSQSFNYVVSDADASLTAHFRYAPGNPGEPGVARLRHVLSLSMTPSSAGSFNVSSGNVYETGTSVYLRAYSNQYYTFQYWAIGDSVVSGSYAFNYVMPDADAHLTAHYTYEYTPGNPNEPGKPDGSTSLYGMTETTVRGQSIQYPVYLENNYAVNGIVVDVRFPAGFGVHTDDAQLSGRMNGQTLEVTDLTDNSYRFTIKGTEDIAGDNGKILDIPVDVPDTATMGRAYVVELSHGVAYASDGKVNSISVRSGIISIETVSEDGLYSRYSFDKSENRVKFKNQSSDKAKRFEWNFGDGTSSEEREPLHIYAKSGTYTVTLTAFGEVDSDVAEATVIINPESSWKAQGTYYLGKELKGARYFTSYEDVLRQIMGASAVAGDITIQVLAGETFSCPLSQDVVSLLTSLDNALSNGQYKLRFYKQGQGSNPVIGLGTTNPATYDQSIVQSVISLGRSMEFDGVEQTLWGARFNTQTLHNLPQQVLCSGEKSERVDFSLISPDMTFSWKVSSVPNGCSGHETQGTRVIPVMTLVHTGVGEGNLQYAVTASYEGNELFSFEYSIAVKPSLVGIFTDLSPAKDARMETATVDLTWNGIVNAHYDLYVWDAVNAMPATPALSSSEALHYTLSQFCQNGHSYRWMVRAFNECHELWSDTMSFSVAELPDLHVYALDCSEAVAGQKVTIQWRVQNDGAGPTGSTQWNDYIWLVTDVYGGTINSTSTNNAQLIATVPSVKSLESGESYENKIEVTLSDKTYGNCYLMVGADMYSITDIQWSSIGGTVIDPYNPRQDGSGYKHLFATTTASYNKLYEQGETSTLSDNFFYKKLEIAVPLLADLQVSEVKYTVIPIGDIDDLYHESEEEKQAWEAAQIPTPLTVAGVAHNTELYSGKTLKVSARIDNKGSAGFGRTSVRCGLYLSHSANPEDINAGTVLVATSRIPPNQWKSLNENAGTALVATSRDYLSIDPEGYAEVNFKFDLPYEWYGETYLHVYADLDEAVNELANTVNNWGTSDKMDVRLCPGADFVPADLQVPQSVSSSSSFNVAYQVKNRGAGVPYTGAWYDKIFISAKSDGLDESAILLKQSIANQFHYENTIAGVYDVRVVFPAEDYTPMGDDYSQNVTVTLDRLAAGTYYIYVQVDYTDYVFEYDGEDNNVIRSGPVKVKYVEADLNVALESVSEDTLSGGSEVALAWKLSNTGTGDIKDVTIRDEFYASVNMDGSGWEKIASVDHSLWLAAGAEKTIRANVKMPDGLKWNGVRYLFVKTNVTGSLQEIKTSDNISAGKKTWFSYTSTPVIKGTDLSVTGLSMQDKVAPGATGQLALTVRNYGNKDMSDKSVPVAVYVGSDTDLGRMTVCEVTSVQKPVAGILSGQSLTSTVQFKVPSDMKGGRRYVRVIVDGANTLGEKNTDNNTSYTSFWMDGNLPDLTIQQAALPDTILSSEQIPLTFSVLNSGQWKSERSTARVYLSPQSNNLSGATQLASLSVGALDMGASAGQAMKFSVPDSKPGKWYIVIDADADSNVQELSESNNRTALPIMVVQSPLPNLKVSGFTTDEILTCGTQMKLRYTVENKGAHATRSGKWSDAFYLSANSTLDVAQAIKLGAKGHVGTLDKGASYTADVTLSIPASVQGNYMLFVVTDASNAITEDGENDNACKGAVYVNGTVDTPADLVVGNVDAPSHLTAGAQLSISYDLSNIGDYTLTGTLNDVIYLSSDKQWDVNDEMVGVVSGKATVNPGNTLTRTVKGKIVNMPEGDYYVIVKTNTSKTLAEKSYDNNVGISSMASTLSFQSLTLGSSTEVNVSGYYKVDVPNGSEGKTIGLYIDYPENAQAGLYAAYEYVPSTAKCDFHASELVETQQEVLLPDVKQGTYYILAQDNGAVVNGKTNVFTLDGSDAASSGATLTLTAKELQFGATSLDIKEGGNGGWVSTGISGALFDTIMDFRLARGQEVIPAEVVTFQNMTRSRVTFNLNDADAGTYDVVSELPDGSQAVMKDGFKVIPGASVGLGIKLDVPSVVRVSNYAPFSLTYANGGNTNCEIYGLVVVIDDGYLGTSIKDLDRHQSRLDIDLDTEGDSRGYMSIPPGTQKTVNLFMYQTASSSNITVYIVK